MKRICYIIAVLLTLTWASVFFFFRTGAQVHVLILLAIVSYLHAVLTCSHKVYSARSERRKMV